MQLPILILLLSLLIKYCGSVNSPGGDDYFKMAENMLADDEDDYLEIASLYWNALLLSSGSYFCS